MIDLTRWQNTGSEAAEAFGSLLPRRIAELRTEAHLGVIVPWFRRSLDIPGDICEFGCFRGTMSIKFACVLKALGIDKTVYAFDTFEGFQMADPAGGGVGIGAYSDNDNSFEELERWSSVIPVRPVKGDARETCATLSGELSFVMLDLNMEVLLGPVLDGIWPLLHADTIIAINDVGRPETPSIEPWVERLTQAGRLIELGRDDGAFISFFHPAVAPARVGTATAYAVPPNVPAPSSPATTLMNNPVSSGPGDEQLEPLGPLLPRSVAQLRTEAKLGVIAPWFWKSLDIPGDLCEFGCFRGTMSIKLAYLIEAMGRNKKVYAFDTFEGFPVADPSGGALGIGAYQDNDDAFEELERWSAIIPVRPIKGDARQTCRSLTGELSFIWFDLDFGTLMEPILETIWPLLSHDTIIGIDDVGRPETPSVAPWVDRVTQARKLIELERYPEDFIRFFHANKD